jgi:hypothetical protein
MLAQASPSTANAPELSRFVNGLQLLLALPPPVRAIEQPRVTAGSRSPGCSAIGDNDTQTLEAAQAAESCPSTKSFSASVSGVRPNGRTLCKPYSSAVQYEGRTLEGDARWAPVHCDEHPRLQAVILRCCNCSSRLRIVHSSFTIVVRWEGRCLEWGSFIVVVVLVSIT